MKAYSPPEYPDITGLNTIFLGGSIEMGKAREWQKDFILRVESLIKHSPSLMRSWAILNPRRKEWDSTWIQDISFPQFNQQVNWELDYLERATHRVFYFATDTLSPVTLMELGKFGDKNSYVIYDDGYLRKGNVQIFCHRYGIPVYPDIQTIINKIFNK